MKKFYYLQTCSTCKRIMAQLKLGAEVGLREIKSSPPTEAEVDALAAKAGSYEAIFSKRATKFRALGLHELTLSEKDYRHYLLQDYTFLKRPVLETAHHAIAGNSGKEVKAMQAAL